jgi:peptidoglycan hydrolase CwlO-like protein
LSIARADTPIEDDRATLITRRTEDIRRTQKRIDALVLDTQNAETKLRETNVEVALLERELGRRARFMYKLNRRGGSFRYLLTADSIMTLLKRAGTLKRLINDELVVLRDKGRTVAELSNRVRSNELELQKAGEMQKMLEQTLADLRQPTF